MSGWAKVTENRDLGRGVHLLGLEAPALAAQARPGQFIMLRVSHGLDPLLARPFSIHGVESERLLILYKVVGKGTKLLRLARPGKTLSLWGPLGRGFGLSPARPLLVAGGMGLAPLAFAAARLAAQGRAPRLLCGLPDKDFLAPWVADPASPFGRHGLAVSFSTEDGSLGRPGLVTALLAEELAQGGEGQGVLACGPMPMLKAVAGLCAAQGVPCQVSLEAPMACGIGACLGCAIPAAKGGYLRACQEGPVLDAGAVDWQRVA